MDRRILLGILVAAMLFATIVPASALIGIWGAQNDGEPGVPTAGKINEYVGYVDFNWVVNNTLNQTDAYNVSIYDSTGARLSWSNNSGNTSTSEAVSGSPGHVYIGVWAFNNSNNGGATEGNFSTHSINLSGHILQARGTSPSVPSAAIVPVAGVFAIALYFIYRRRK